MISLLQRVTHASVVIADETIASIDNGILVLIGVEKNDDATHAKRMADRLCHYRIFSDDDDKMNLNVIDKHASLLLVPQFTLAADTSRGRRASFTSAATPDIGLELFNQVVDHCRQLHANVQVGQFAAHMMVNLCNDGPVTFILRV